MKHAIVIDILFVSLKLLICHNKLFQTVNGLQFFWYIVTKRACCRRIASNLIFMRASISCNGRQQAFWSKDLKSAPLFRLIELVLQEGSITTFKISRDCDRGTLFIALLFLAVFATGVTRSIVEFTTSRPFRRHHSRAILY